MACVPASETLRLLLGVSLSPGSQPALSPRGSEHPGGPSQTDITAQASWRKVLREGSSYLETGLRQDRCCECEGNMGCRMGTL